MISLIVTALPLQLLAVETHASYKVVSDKPVSDKPVSDKPVSDPLDTQITTNAHFKVMAGEHVVKGGIWELEGDEVIYGTLEFIGSAINLNGYKLTVLGDFIHSSGTLTFNEGSVVVEGGYRLQKKEVGQDGIEKYTMGTGYLMMKNDADYMLVKRDFIMESYYQHSEGMKAGTIEVKGDFRQIACAYRPSFYGSGTHKVILSGRQKQIVEMQEHDSRFNILELKNTSKQGIEFISDTEIKSLYTNEGRVSFEKGIRGFKLEEDVIINGNVTITGDIDLNAHELTVKGDLINPQGGIYFNKGRLNIEGDYRLQRKEVGQDGIEKYSMGTGYLMMLSDEDYMLVNGDFIMESYYQHSEAMKAGTIEVKGDFRQIACYYTPSFYGSGTHKVILSGNKIQTVEMQESNSRFNTLITTKPLSEYIFLPSTREVFWVQHIYDPNAGIGIGGADGNQPNISKQMTSMFTGIVYQECKVDQDHGRLKATLNDVKFEKSNNIIRIKGNIEVEGQTQMFNLSGEYFRIKDEPFGDRTYISLNSDSTYDVLACSIQKDAHLRTLYDEKAELEGKDVFRITLKDKNNNRIIDIEDKIENYKSVIQNVPYEDTYQNNVIKNDMDTWFVDYVVRREISYNPDDYIDNTSSFNMDGLRKSKLPIHGYFYNTKGEKVYYGEGTNLIMGVTMAKVFTPEKDTNINNQMIVVQNSNNKEGYAFINTVDPRLKTVHTNFLKWEVSLTQPDNNGEYIISLRIAESAEYLYAEAPEGVPENWGDKHKFYKLGKAGSVPQNKIKMKDIKVTQKLGLTGAKGQPDLTFFAGGTDIEYSGEEEFNAKIIIPIAADLATITPWPVGLSEIVMPRVYAAADIYRQLKKIEAPIASSDDKIFGPWQTHMQKMLNNGEDPFYWYPIEVNGFGPTYIPQLRKSSTIIIEELMLNEYEDSLQIKSKIGALTSKSNIKEKPLTNDTQVNEMMETIKHVYVHGASRGSFEKEMEVIFEFDLITKAEVINKEQPIKLTYSIRYY